MTNLVQFPGLGLSFELDRVAFSIGGMNIYWYGVCIAVGMCLALVFAFRHSVEFGVDADAMVDVILIGVVMGILCARLYYVALSPYQYHSLKDVLAIRDGGLAIYGGIIGAFLFGGLACNFFNQEAFGCNTTLPWGMYSQATHDYLTSSVVTVPRGVTIDPNLPVHPTFLYESIWCFVGLFLLVRYLKKRRFAGDIALRYLVWYGAGRFWIEALRTDSLLLVPSIGLRVSQLVAGVAVVGGVIAEILLTKKFRDKPLMVELPLNSENRARMKKLDGPTTFAGTDAALPASASRAEFVEKTAAWNETVKEALDRREHPEKNEKNPE